MTGRCRAAQCGRAHGLDYMFSVFADAMFCSFHRGKLEAGEGVECRGGDTAWYDEYTGLVLMPPEWEPRKETTDE